MLNKELKLKSNRKDGFDVTNLSFIIPDLPVPFSGFKILQLTDFHYGPCTSRDHLERVIAVANDIEPDLVVLTGDYLQPTPIGIPHALAARLGAKFVGWPEYRRIVRERAEQFAEILQTLNPTQGIISVLGNHDYYEGAGTIIRALNGQTLWLKNDGVLLRSAFGDLLIAGTDDVKMGNPDLERTQAVKREKPLLGARFLDSDEAVLSEKHQVVFRLLLSHNPDITIVQKSSIIEDFDLMLCGHTHGGQICLPFIGIAATRTKQRVHISGASYFGKTPVYVSRGIGYGLLPFRLNCPPEMVVVEFNRKER